MPQLDPGEWIAVYAAIVGTIGLVVAGVVARVEFRRFEDERSRFKVECSRGFHASGHDYDDPTGETELIEIRVTNMGTRPLRLAEAGFEMSIGEPFPCEVPIGQPLDPGDSREGYITPTALRRELMGRGPTAKVSSIYARHSTGKIDRYRLSRQERDQLGR